MSYESLGAQVFAASELGSRIQPWWNVRSITPRGETGPLTRYPRRFATPVDGGAAHPVVTFYGRKIGPQGATGPVIPLGDEKMSYDYQDEYNRAIGTKLLPRARKYVRPMGDVPVWERGQFTYGAGPFAPGGPGGGMTIGPRQFGGPGACSEVSGGTLTCVQPPYSPREADLPDREEPPYTGKGVVAGRGWPPEIGPQEEQLMEVGCVATGRRCGGSARAPAQYWCCPSPGGMPMPFIGTPFPTNSGGLGSLTFEQFIERYGTVTLVAGVSLLAYMMWKGAGIFGRGKKPYSIHEEPTMVGGQQIYTITTTRDGHVFAWLSQDPKTGLWGVTTDISDVNAEAFPSMKAAASWAFKRLKDYEEYEFSMRQAMDYLAVARKTRSISDVEKAMEYAYRAGVAAMGVEAGPDEREPLHSGPYQERSDAIYSKVRKLWIKLEPEIEYEISK